MKRLRRPALSAASTLFLHKRSVAVAAAADSRAEAARLWSLQGNNAFREVRALLEEMASGRERCVYCEDSEGIAIEHFWPKSRYPQRAFDWSNYLLACTRCNSNYKRDQFPLAADGGPLLINPVDEDPLDHLLLSPTTGKLTPASPKGQPSIDVFGLDRPTLEEGRKHAWTTLQALLIWYADLRRASAPEDADRAEAATRRQSFAGVFAALVRIAKGPGAEALLDPRCLAALAEFPEILGWA